MTEMKGARSLTDKACNNEELSPILFYYFNMTKIRNNIYAGQGMEMDIERIRKDLLDNLKGAYFIGGYGGAIMEAHDIENMSPDEIIELAAEQGLDLNRYR